MRGKDRRGVALAHGYGITPAYAGKSCALRLKLLVLRDHPRVCGEKAISRLMERRVRGSPPRMRGKGLLEVFVPEPLRITPAYAGKRWCQ